MSVMVLECPLSIIWYVKTVKGETTISLTPNGNKAQKFILNLNNYRNAQHIMLAGSKKAYHMVMAEVIQALPDKVDFRGKQFACRFDYWHPNNRAVDVSNPVSIIEKYVFDALQECGIISDDNCNNLVRHDGWKWMGVDKDLYPNGMCKLYLYEA